ncbi:copper chaperone PCu(A)C [Solimonas marina]|uniref:Copper chaperone PCu(A)C n=1 Tax=Solimonas marina TaxID=2714601 RepID=A0A969WEX6_9GAMM|nr:copper chaperone PCu(A)C [Solimonas marina]NKF24076.1 copper chaperone PCu(A)C [Solimonas marina]
MHRICKLTATALIATMAVSAEAADSPASPVIEDAWIRALPGDLPAAGYFSIHNLGDAPRQLTRADTPEFAGAMLHLSSEQDGQSQMQHVDGVTVAAHGRVSFRPGSYHLMLMHAKAPLTIGSKVPIALHFDDGSSVVVPFIVKGASATAY